MLKIGISFNYKDEKRSAFLHLIIPALISIPLLMVTVVVYEPDWDSSPQFLEWAGPEFLRDNICIFVTMSFSIFIRSLHIRFAALNTLLRFHCFYLLCVSSRFIWQQLMLIWITPQLSMNGSPLFKIICKVKISHGGM